MNRLSVFIRRRRKLVLGVWVGLLLASAPLASQQTKNLTGGGFEVPGTGSDQVDKQIGRFQGATGDPLGIVLQRKGGDAAGLQAAVDRVDKVAANVDHVELSSDASRAAKAAAAKQPVIVFPLAVSGTRDDTLEAAVDLREELGVGEVTDGVQPYVVGQQALWAGMQELQRKDLEKAETIGFPIILIVLLAVFGSAVAALLPVGLGVAAVIVTGAAIFLVSLITTMSVFVTNVASMLGIGVAVDYSLFMLSRYREEIAEGRSRDEALDIAMRTSGATVLFSGMTVVVSLVGLFLLDSTVLRSLAIGAIVVVAIAVLGAVTLLPALVAVLGRRAEERGRVVSATGALLRRIGRRPAPGEIREGPDFWERWTATLMRRPALFATLAAAVMLALAVPALSLAYGNGALRMFPKDNEARQGAELGGKLTSPGASAPMLVVADFKAGLASSSENRAALKRYVAGVEKLRPVAGVNPPQTSKDGRASLIPIILKQDPESPTALAMVDTLRDEGGQAAGLDRVATVEVGGASAQEGDYNILVHDEIWKIFVFVLFSSYVILFVVLRSVLLPLKAILMNLLSVGAAYGVLVIVFQYGWLDGITGFESLGYINALTPPLLLAIVFGLSMDYEVFLLLRIRERYDATGDNRTAVAQGLRASAKVISSAAVIMVVVFAVFALTGVVPQIKEIGVGLAVAIGLDATLVRLVLVPATMELMGDWNWWLPKSFERVLPDLDLEGDGAVEEARPAAAVV